MEMFKVTKKVDEIIKNGIPMLVVLDNGLTGLASDFKNLDLNTITTDNINRVIGDMICNRFNLTYTYILSNPELIGFGISVLLWSKVYNKQVVPYEIVGNEIEIHRKHELLDYNKCLHHLEMNSVLYIENNTVKIIKSRAYEYLLHLAKNNLTICNEDAINLITLGMSGATISISNISTNYNRVKRPTPNQISGMYRNITAPAPHPVFGYNTIGMMPPEQDIRCYSNNTKSKPEILLDNRNILIKFIKENNHAEIMELYNKHDKAFMYNSDALYWAILMDNKATFELLLSKPQSKEFIDAFKEKDPTEFTKFLTFKNDWYKRLRMKLNKHNSKKSFSRAKPTDNGGYLKFGKTKG